MLIHHTDTNFLSSIGKWICAMCLLPLYNVYAGSAWYLLAVLVCIIADYRFGRGENRKRYADAKEAGNESEMLHYQWRRSHAWRRTLTKIGDYFLVVTVGVFIGHAFLGNFGVAEWWGGAIATAICIACELISIFGHFFYLKGIEINPQTLKKSATRFAISFARHKDPDIGESLEEALGEEKPRECKHPPDGSDNDDARP